MGSDSDGLFDNLDVNPDPEMKKNFEARYSMHRLKSYHHSKQPAKLKKKAKK